MELVKQKYKFRLPCLFACRQTSSIPKEEIFSLNICSVLLLSGQRCMCTLCVYAHKTSWESVNSAPCIERDLQVHQVMKSWNEYKVTNVYRQMKLKGVSHIWHLMTLMLSPTLKTIFTGRPAGYIEFDVTEAMQNWGVKPASASYK